MENNKNYVVMDSRHMPLARAVLESPPSSPTYQICVQDGDVEKVLEHEIVELISMGDGMPSLVGRIINSRGERLVLEKLRALGTDVRQNLRMPVDFESFIYPLTGGWKGRREVKGHDISCSGIAFHCSSPLRNNELIEIVIPVTEAPLVLRTKILCTRPSNSSIPLYAAEFVNLVPGEEALMREAVFGIQLQGRQKKTVATIEGRET